MIQSDAPLAKPRLCCFFFDAAPIVAALPVRAVEAQRQHGLDIRRRPPRAGQLEPLLDHMAVGAFDLARADGQAPPQSAPVIQLGQAVAQVAVAGGHRAAAAGFQAGDAAPRHSQRW